MKRILLLSYLFLELQLLFAQTTISISANAVRHEDDLLKIQIPYIESGNPGNDIVWQLGIATDDSPEFLQSINSNGDTIAIYEEGRMLHFLMRNDTLYDKGTQSRRAHKVYAQERPVLHYPFGYGDRIEGSYAGEGRDENLTYTVDGNSPLRILASDILGSLLGYAHYDARPAGTWQENIDLSLRPVGGIVVINVECGAQSLMMKVME